MDTFIIGFVLAATSTERGGRPVQRGIGALLMIPSGIGFCVGGGMFASVSTFGTLVGVLVAFTALGFLLAIGEVIAESETHLGVWTLVFAVLFWVIACALGSP